MSYEAYGDDDDGLDGVREAYRESLIQDGWLDDVQAQALIRTVEDLALMIRRLAHAAQSGNPGLADRALDLLERKGLSGNPLRKAEP